MPRYKNGKAALPKPKPYADMTLDDLRQAIKKHKEEGLKIISHHKHVTQLYEEWEDKFIEIEKMVEQLKEDTGVTDEEIYEPPKSELDNISDEVGF